MLQEYKNTCNKFIHETFMKACEVPREQKKNEKLALFLNCKKNADLLCPENCD